MSTAEQYVLRRTGESPLRIVGRKLAEVTSRRDTADDPTRWYELAVYETAQGRTVVQIVFRTGRDEERDYHSVQILDEPVRGADVETVLLRHDPVPDDVGYPPGAQYQDRQGRLVKRLQRDYQECVSDLLEKIGAETVVE